MVAGNGFRSPSPSNGDNNKRPVMRLTSSFLLITTILACAVAFLFGTACRMFLLQPRLYGLSFMEGLDIYKNGGEKEGNTKAVYSSSSESLTSSLEDHQLPAPRLHHGKVMPETRYTAKDFPEDGNGSDAVRSSHHLHIQPSISTSTCSAVDTESTGAQCRAPISNRDSDHNASATSIPTDDEEDGEHLPAGQHLLVDIKNVDSDFLNSEQRLAQAMVEVVSLSQLTLLSYHCHALIPKGVSCVGVLLESHISFHTWPDESVIILDLFTCGSGLLVPVMPVIERLFGVPQEGAGRYIPTTMTAANDTPYTPREEDYVDPPRVVWSHVLRGFRPRLEKGWRPLENDIGEIALEKMDLDYKEVITTTVTDYQQIDVVDTIDPRNGNIRSYERSLRPEIKTYESAHPEFFKPNRMVFLDGVLQSTSQGDEAYHEALVHPAMFVHFEPKRVAIIGGGEGATLREVLKHKTLEEVKMIEIDEKMVNKSREVLPGWSDCSELEGSAQSCFDDPRTDLRCEDALAWFIDQFSEQAAEADSSDDEEEDSSDDDEEDAVQFDVIIMDALDPQDNIEFADALYNNDVFLHSLYRGLTDDGVMVLQLGESPNGQDPAEELTDNNNRHQIMTMIEDLGFKSMHIYEESHCNFGYPWSFLVACKSEGCRYNWYMNEAEIDIQIQQRMIPTVTEDSPLHYFDGATMKGYQVPPKAWETVYCRRDPVPDSCVDSGYNKRTKNYNIDNFEVRSSSTGNGAGRGVFAKVDVPEGSYIGAEQKSKNVHFAHTTTELMEKLYYNYTECKDLGNVLRYAYGYGFQQKTMSSYQYFVASCILTYVNHGCNGTSNIGKGADDVQDVSYFNEASIDLSKMQVPSSTNGRKSVFDPVIDRHLLQSAVGSDEAERNIKAGEELFKNYLYFLTSAKDRRKEVTELQAVCQGKALGQIE